MKAKLICFYFISFFGSVIFTYYYFLYTHEYPPGSSERIANFEANKMFQTRMLIICIANFLEPTLPILHFMFQWIIPYPINYEVLLQIINVVFTFLLVLSLPSLLECLDCKTTKGLSLIIFIPISWNYVIINGLIDGCGLYYSFDIPSLTFFSFGLIFFLKRKWFLFYPVFVLGCLNRESAAFISVGGAFLCFNIKSLNIKYLFISNQSLLYHIFTQFIVWLSLRIILSFAVKDNPGILFEQPQSMVVFLSYMWSGESHWAMQNPLWFLTLFMSIWLVPTLLYTHLSSQGRRLLLVGIIYLIVVIFRSNMMETRVYNELNVILTVCTIICISNFLKKNPFKSEVDHS